MNKAYETITQRLTYYSCRRCELDARIWINKNLDNNTVHLENERSVCDQIVSELLTLSKLITL